MALKHYQSLQGFVAQKRYAEAEALAEKAREDAYGKKNVLLYHLDRGLLLHLAGRYADSNAAFEEAKTVAADLFTRSISAEAATLLVNDAVRPYPGEDFERSLIYLFGAMNYVLLGRPAEALVEARQVDHYLNTLQATYHGKGPRFQEDAFARYLAGLLYEDQGEINDAFISYRKALEAYEMYAREYEAKIPPALVGDALRTAARLGFHSEAVEIREKYGSGVQTSTTGQGEIVIIHYSGLSPKKASQNLEVAFGRGWGYVQQQQVSEDEHRDVEKAGAAVRALEATYQLLVAFPVFEPQTYRIHSGIVRTDAGPAASTTELVEPVGRIAMETLEDRVDRIRVRAIARATLKYALSKIAENEAGKEGKFLGWLVGAGLRVFNAVTEEADLRAWRLLPDEIRIARLAAMPGQRTVEATWLDERGWSGGHEVLGTVAVTAGKRTYLVVRTAE